MNLVVASSCLLALSLNALMGQGRQLTGNHAPSAQAPLAPEEAQSRFTLHEGFEARLFASEPDVVNPVAMTWDERGRLWVVELYEYPLGAKDGEKPRDNIKILEDTDADGRADKVTVFADGLNLATGILLGNGGAYVGQAPHLLFLKDTDGDDIADERTILKTGFGLEDRHELLNGFTWGPDGWLYMTHGVFTHSTVKDPNDPNDDGIYMNAAVARFHPKTQKFEIFADGTSNPWGVDFDRTGNAFVSACVIDHLFHMAPGGLYVRQGGQPEYKYTYELLPSIVDHKHYRAAYCGIQVYLGDQYPRDYYNRVFMGNIHSNAVNHDRLETRGSSFTAHEEKDFVNANDGWFRPISEQVGPDGALWIGDWYDKYPCYQNARADPEGVDRSYGRIWRIVHTGNQPGKAVPSRPSIDMDLSKLPTSQLVDRLQSPNIWQRKMAQRLLAERQDSMAKASLERLLTSTNNDKETHLETRLSTLWTLHQSEQLTEATLDKVANDREPAIRAWAARLTGERRNNSPASLERLIHLASDHDPTVRLAVAVAARQHVSDFLTLNKQPSNGSGQPDPGLILAPLVQASADEEDQTLHFLIWTVAEPKIAEDPEWALGWLLENGQATKPLSQKLVYKVMRRLCDAGESWRMDIASRFINDAANWDSDLAIAALEGLLDGQEAQAILPSRLPENYFSNLTRHNNSTLAEQAMRLGAVWGDATAVRQLVQQITDLETSEEARIKAIAIASGLPSAAVREALSTVLANARSAALVRQAIEALGSMGGDEAANTIIAAWNKLGTRAKRTAAETLASRTSWAKLLLDAVENKTITSSEIPTTVVRSLARNRSQAVRSRAAKVIGRFREPNADLAKLIYDKTQVVLDGHPDIEAGRKIAEQACLVCHKLYGKGAEVGPDLTGVGRSDLAALLANIINPNQIIGNGYENVEVETKDDRIVSGRLLEENDNYVKIVSAGPIETTVARTDIQTLTKSDTSVMPEGLEQLPDVDFRNMIWFLLNPPEEGRPMTEELRAELIGALPSPPRDYESIALWNPEWNVKSSENQQAPGKLPQYCGKKNILVTHPYWHQGPATIARDYAVPTSGSPKLKLNAAAAKEGKWVLRVFADAKMVHRQVIEGRSECWTPVEVDLTPFAGKTIPIKIENYAYSMENDFAYWHNLRIESE